MSPRPALAAVAAALLAVLPAASAAQQAPAAAADTARIDRAQQLTALINPFDAMVAGNLQGWEAALVRSMSLDPGVTRLETQYPGIGKAAVEAARPVARRYCETFVTRVNARTAQIFAERLSSGEIDELIAFYRGDLGRRVVSQVIANFDLKGVGREVADRKARTGNAEITMDEVKRQGDLAGRRAVTDFSAADQIALMRFGQTPAAKKFAAAREAAEREVLEMANNPDPQFVAAQSEALKAAMIAFADSRKRP